MRELRAVTAPRQRRLWLSRGWIAAEPEYRWRAGPLFLSQFAVLGLQMAWQGSATLPVALLPGSVAVIASGVAVAARIWGTGTLSAATMMSMSPVTDRLITGGIFGLVRNPLYVADFLIFTSYTLLLNPWLAPWFGLYHILRILRLIAYEEDRLLSKWGAAYEQYCHEVPRLVPRFVRVAAVAVSWRDGVAGSSIWIGFFLGYIAAVFTGDLWSLTGFELAGFLFFFYQFSKKTSSASSGGVADSLPD
jgi:protein-S-isoprenylcysteine O-methyltransferase Ste14